MRLNHRIAFALALAGVVAAVCVVALQPPTQAHGQQLAYSHLSKMQKKIISQTLASALGPATTRAAPVNDQGGGADGAPNGTPSSYAAAGPNGGGGSSGSNYFPSSDGQCSARLGNNVKVNQNCLNITDPDLQGRAQANNETSIAQNPFNTSSLVASDNNYIRGDGTCGAHYSLDGGRNWQDSTVPNSFTRGPSGFAREYWQAGGDTAVAWDSRGNAYMSCQLFNRGNVASPNPDQSSAFVLYRSTANNGASWNFPGRYSTVFFDPAGTGSVLEDKALMTVDNNPSSPYRDRIYVTWTEFAADMTAYIYEVHSDDYGETFSNRVLVSADNPACTNTFGAATPNGKCNMNQFSDPFVGPDGKLYVAYDNFNNQATTGTDNRYQVLLAKSNDGGQSFSAPVKVSDYYDLPDCDTYQGAGANPGRSCVPEKGASTSSVFRATNYPSGQVDPQHPDRVVVAFGSYINRNSKESNGCTPTGFALDGNPIYTGVKVAGACNNKILLSVSRDGAATFSGTTQDPRLQTLVPQSRGQARTDQFWQWSAFTRDGRLAVDYYDRQFGDDETSGSSDLSLSGSNDLAGFTSTRVTSSSMPLPTQFSGPKGGRFYGDYIGLAAIDNKAHPLWSDTRSKDLFVCPGSATPGNPPQLCGATEPNGQTANDQDLFTSTLNVPGGHGEGGNSRRH